MEEEKKITVDELKKKVEAARKTKKDYPFAKHIIREYLSHAEKLALVKGVVNASSYVEVNGKKIYKRDTPLRMFLFSMRLITLYTDIEINISKIDDEYDKLVSSGAMNGLLSSIPSEEINILQGMLDLVQDDLETNTRDFISFLESKIELVGIAFNTLLDVLDRPDIKQIISDMKEKNS